MTPHLADTPVLETERLVLRAPSGADTQAMLSFFESDRAAFYGGPMETLEAWRKYAAFVGQWVLRGYGMYAVTLKDGGDTAGLAGAYHPDGFPEPEMSWLLTDARHEGKGYAHEACAAVLGDIFTRQSWTSVVSYIDTENVASRKLALRLGAVADPGAVSPIPGCEAFRHFAPGAAA